MEGILYGDSMIFNSIYDNTNAFQSVLLKGYDGDNITIQLKDLNIHKSFAIFKASSKSFVVYAVGYNYYYLNVYKLDENNNICFVSEVTLELYLSEENIFEIYSRQNNLCIVTYDRVFLKDGKKDSELIQLRHDLYGAQRNYCEEFLPVIHYIISCTETEYYENYDSESSKSKWKLVPHQFFKVDLSM